MQKKNTPTNPEQIPTGRALHRRELYIYKKNLIDDSAHIDDKTGPKIPRKENQLGAGKRTQHRKTHTPQQRHFRKMHFTSSLE